MGVGAGDVALDRLVGPTIALLRNRRLPPARVVAASSVLKVAMNVGTFERGG